MGGTAGRVNQGHSREFRRESLNGDGGTVSKSLTFLLEVLWFLFFRDYASFGVVCLYTGEGVKCRLGGQSCRRPLVSSEDSAHGATG